MTKIFFICALMTQISLPALAGFVPPPENPYWCYEACVDSHYTNHTACVKKCYGSRRSIFNSETQVNSNCAEPSPLREENEPMAAACCSWGENINGCMPGC